MDREDYNAKRFQGLFSDFNNRYFKGKLPRYRIQVVRNVSQRRPNMQGVIYRRRRLIRLKQSDEQSMIGILLHEMAHAANKTDGHGPKFLEILKELKKAGAPVADYEFEEPLGPNRLTTSFFKSTVNDVLIHVPDITLRKMLGWFINDYGYAVTTSALLRRYPWIPRVFMEEKRDVLKAKEIRSARFDVEAKTRRD